MCSATLLCIYISGVCGVMETIFSNIRKRFSRSPLTVRDSQAFKKIEITTESSMISCVFTLMFLFLHMRFCHNNAGFFCVRIFTSISDVTFSVTVEPMHTHLIL